MLRLGLAWWRRLWHRGLPPRSILSLIFALCCVAAATFVRMVLGAVSPESAVFAPYYAATLVAALVGGAGAGGFAAAAGALAAFWLFVPPDWKSHAFDMEQMANLVLFAASSLVIVWAAKSYRDLLWRLREEQKTRQLLNHELAHRIRNTLAMVQAVASQTLRDQPAVGRKLNDRLAALAATNDLLIESEWRGAFLKKILAGEFAPYDPSRFRLDGEDFECPSEIATMLALIFHELTTNAAKYGALAAPLGRVELSWKRRNERVDFHWIESGGPPPPPTLSAPPCGAAAATGREGFGTTLIRKGLQQFDGSVTMRFAPTGLHCTFSLALPSPVHRDTAAPAAEPRVHAGTLSTPSVSTTVR